MRANDFRTYRSKRDVRQLVNGKVEFSRMIAVVPMPTTSGHQFKRRRVVAVILACCSSVDANTFLKTNESLRDFQVAGRHVPFRSQSPLELESQYAIVVPSLFAMSVTLLGGVGVQLLDDLLATYPDAFLASLVPNLYG